MHVRVKFVDGRRDTRDTAGHPFEGQPHSGFRRAKCPHLVDIRRTTYGKARPPDRELTFPVQTKTTVLLAAEARLQRSRLGVPRRVRLIRTASSVSSCPLGGMRLAR